LPDAPRSRSGLLYGLAAYGFWGVVPLYFKALAAVPAPEQLAHRVVWTLALLAVVLTVVRRWGDLARALRDRGIRRTLLASAVLIAVNWLVYIHGVNTERIVETSLGYYIAPLASVLLGRLALGERLSRWRWLAVGLAAAGVLTLVVATGGFPWIALTLAGSFSVYGLLRKRVPVDGLLGLAVETLVLFPFAVGYLAVMEFRGGLAFGHLDRVTDLMLVAGGAVTAAPLICFAQAARRLPLATLGFLQYIAPTCQFAIAALWFGEPFPPERLFGFLWIWAGLVVYSVDSIREHRKRPDAAPIDPEPEMELERG
jgi:chloramphenicol-sensitive protein RarD